MEILAVKDLSFSYPTCSEAALTDVSFSLERGEFAVLCGATGSGKSTLLRMLKRELSPLGKMTGDVTFSGTPLDKLNDKVSASAIGFVMQDPEQQMFRTNIVMVQPFGFLLGKEKHMFRSRREISQPGIQIIKFRHDHLLFFLFVPLDFNA